jgi:hypothetical protein
VAKLIISPTRRERGDTSLAVTIPSSWVVTKRSQYVLVEAESSLELNQHYVARAKDQWTAAGAPRARHWVPAGLPGIWVSSATDTYGVFGARVYPDKVGFAYHHNFSVRGIMDATMGLVTVLTLGLAVAADSPADMAFAPIVAELMAQHGGYAGLLQRAGHGSPRRGQPLGENALRR